MEKGLYFSCEIGGLTAPVLDVVDFTLEEALSTLFTLKVKVASNDSDIDLDALLLQNASLIIKIDGVIKRTINGIVSQAYQGNSGFKRTYYTFIIRPELWLLTLTQDNRIFHQKTIPAILDELLQKHHVRAESKLIDTHKQWEYTTQRNETDYDFFCRLAAEEGIVFWFEENQMFYSDSRAGMTGGENLLYNAHIQSVNRESVIHSLEYGAKMQPNAVHLKDYKYTHPDVGLNAKAKNTGSRPQYTMYEGYARYDDDSVAQQYAKYRLEAYQADSLSGVAESNCIQLMPGKIFTISEHPSQSMNSNWQVVRITHRGSLPQSVADESHDSDSIASITNHFSFIPGSVDWRAPFIPKPTVHGNETATVVGPAGEEIYVNEYGEVKVHFHWNQHDTGDENVSLWVRAGQAWNGDGFGFMAIPRIGQEVIISYLNGDIDQPIIVGTVYNGKNATPVNLPKNKTQTTIKTQTHKGEGFNELRFEDENGKQEIYIHAQRNKLIQINNDKTQCIEHDESHSVMNNRSHYVGNDESLHIINDRYIQIDNNQFETIEKDLISKINNIWKEEIRAAHIQRVGENKNSEIQGKYTLDVVEGIHSHTKIHTLQASDTIMLKTSGGTITLDASGITLTGKVIVKGTFDLVGGAPDSVISLMGAVNEAQPLAEDCHEAARKKSEQEK